MSLSDFLHEISSHYREYGFRSALATASQEVLVAGPLRRLDTLGYNRGIPVTATPEDWDVLVILDACRVDLMQEVSPAYDWTPAPNTRTSVAGHSKRWLERTFNASYSDVLAETMYVTGNPFSASTDLSPASVTEVWRDHWSEEDGTVPARPITDAAIRAHRNGAERLIIHYMQPHYPFVPDPIGGGFYHSVVTDTKSDQKNVWTRLEHGEIDFDRVWQAYRENLEYVLEDVNILRKNIDADSFVITADHGNAVGEFGIYGHPGDIPLRCIRKVPWIELRATDTGSYVPPETEESTVDDVSVEDRLEDLGYL